QHPLKLHCAVQAGLTVLLEILPATGECAESGFIHGKAALVSLALDPLHKFLALPQRNPPAVFSQRAVSSAGDSLSRVRAELERIPAAVEIGVGDGFRLPAFCVHRTPIGPRGLDRRDD